MRSLSFRLLTLGAALTVGVTTAIAQQAQQVQQPPRARAGAERSADRAGRGPGRDGAMRKGAMRKGAVRGGRALLFKDITLSDAQRTRLRAIQDTYATQRRELFASQRTNRPQRSPAQAGQQRQRPDSATRAQWNTQREAMRGQMQQLTQRQEGELRAILTPAQQPTFDRNVAALRQRVSERRDERGQGRPRGERGARRAGAAGRAGR